MAARVDAGAPLVIRRPLPVFSGMRRFLPNFDVAPDGRFVMIRRSEEETSTREIRVILNFFDELKRLAAPSQ
jgi:hypothetical protein